MLWSFRKTGTAETLASQAKIGVCVQALGAALLPGSGGITPRNFFENVYAKSCNLVQFLAGKWFASRLSIMRS